MKEADEEHRSTVVGGCDQISSVCMRTNVDRIVVALNERRGRLPMEQLLRCRMRGIRVDDGVAFTEDLAGKLSVEDIYPSFLVFADGFKTSPIFRKIKRSLDVVASAIGLLLFSPLCLLATLAIRLDSRGTILYRQERVGMEGRTFNLLKFRSMHEDAEHAGPVWASKNDGRVTRAGSVLRKLRLDEIPQMINVLRGEMSFVGPRPERPFFTEQLEKEIPFYSIRSIVKPGITGWAQIRYPYGASKEDALEKLKYDLYYIKHMSIMFDFMIIGSTVKTVLFGRGAR